MKLTYSIISLILTHIIFTPICTLGQNTENDNENALSLKIRESRKMIDTFQAFGVSDQDGPLFGAEPIKPGVRSDWSKRKFVYLSFQNANGRISECKFTDEEMKKTDRFKLSFYSSQLSKSMYYGNSGFHLARYLPGGRYIYEGEGTSIAFPVQTLGFWVSEEKKWPDELLDSGRYHIVGQRLSAIFKTIIDINGKTENNRLTRFSVAPEFGYRVVEAETEDENSIYHTELESLVEVNKVWCPKRFKRSIISKKGYPPSMQYYNLDKIIVNRADKNDILFTSVTGDHNQNIRTNTNSYTLPDGSRKYVTPSNASESFISLLKGWLYIASVTTLLVLTVGAYVKWKRNQLSKSA